MTQMKKIALIGGGPSALYVLKHLLDTNNCDCTIDIFETKSALGHGMPYGIGGANREHVTNISGNEMPLLETSLSDWAHSLPKEKLAAYGFPGGLYSDDKVVPRLFFGDYLEAQFEILIEKARLAAVTVTVHLNAQVTEVADSNEKNLISVTAKNQHYNFDAVILCTGHVWSRHQEGKISGYFDSPYPPSKLEMLQNAPIALRGSSLTAVDAIRTLARHNGSFERQESGALTFRVDQKNTDFKIAMYSKHGLLPCVRTYLEEPSVTSGSTLSDEDISQHIANNGEFLSLDFLFEEDFKKKLRLKDRDFYEEIKDMSLEDFVTHIMIFREEVDPFSLFELEYQEAASSIRQKKSVYWKELLADLNFSINYPAKHFCAEDMLRLTGILLPLISLVIAFVPQSSAEELIALHQAGRLSLIAVDEHSEVETHEGGGVTYRFKNKKDETIETRYKFFIDCVGQPRMPVETFPFKSLFESQSISPARLPFRSVEKARTLLENGGSHIEQDGTDYYLTLSGFMIDDHFRSIGMDGNINPRLYLMAVPYIGGFNPDYSGLDFCDEAARRIAEKILS